MSFEIKQLAGDTWYVAAPTNIGVYRLNERDVCLIDAGPDEDFARALLALVESRGWHVAKLVCTHAHPDHIGGCGYLQRETGCQIFASPVEREIAQQPLLQSALMFGAYPYALMRSKYFMAQPFQALSLDDPAFPSMLETFPLPGHTYNQIGVRTLDGVLFTADALAGVEMLENYHITFLFDVAGCLNTIDWLETREDALYVPSHAPTVESLTAMCAKNRGMIHEIKSFILSILTEPCDLDELLARLFERYHTPINIVQYTLVSHTVRCYLSYLYDAGRIEPVADGFTLKWRMQA